MAPSQSQLPHFAICRPLEGLLLQCSTSLTDALILLEATQPRLFEDMISLRALQEACYLRMRHVMRYGQAAGVLALTLAAAAPECARTAGLFVHAP